MSIAACRPGTQLTARGYEAPVERPTVVSRTRARKADIVSPSVQLADTRVFGCDSALEKHSNGLDGERLRLHPRCRVLVWDREVSVEH